MAIRVGVRCRFIRNGWSRSIRWIGGGAFTEGDAWQRLWYEVLAHQLVVKDIRPVDDGVERDEAGGKTSANVAAGKHHERLHEAFY
ncbi:MAG: hypothetical protein ABSH09_09735 [Bryobacteraceae bacterium]